MRLSKIRAAAVVVCTAVPMLMAMTAPAMAAPPPNDNRADAQAVDVPSTTTGTTVDATDEPGEQLDVCGGQSGGSVWYQFSADGERGVVAKLAADGNLDAEIDIYKQQRSHLNLVACDLTDNQGLAATGFRVTDGATYLIRVANQPNSESDSFTLRLLHGPLPAQPPGQSLASGHATGTLDRVLNVDAAYHLHLAGGKPYRFNLVHGPAACQSMQVFAPGTTDFDAATPVLDRPCGGYALYVPPPGSGGRYFVRLLADRNDRKDQPYRLLAGPAMRNDLAPGRLLHNHLPHGGKVNGGGLDVTDVYRFGVHHRSSLELHLVGQPGHVFQLDLRGGDGHRISCACSPASRQLISLRVKPGTVLRRGARRGPPAFELRRDPQVADDHQDRHLRQRSLAGAPAEGAVRRHRRRGAAGCQRQDPRPRRALRPVHRLASLPALPRPRTPRAGQRAVEAADGRTLAHLDRLPRDAQLRTQRVGVRPRAGRQAAATPVRCAGCPHAEPDLGPALRVGDHARVRTRAAPWATLCPRPVEPVMIAVRARY